MARFIALLTFLLSLSSTPAAATSVLYLTDREQAQQSDAVVFATITDQRVERHPVWNRPTTISTVRVDEVLHGTAPAEFEIHQLKGELNGTTTELPGSANIEKGERVVLFAHIVEGRWYPTALQQSKYSVHETRLGLLLARKPLEADLYTRAPDGALEPIEEPPRKPIYTLDELRKTLAGLKE